MSVNPIDGRDFVKGPQKNGRGQEQTRELRIGNNDRVAPQDSLEISEKARELPRLRTAANELPDVRENRISALQRELSSGTYQVEARQLAQSILRFPDVLVP